MKFIPWIILTAGIFIMTAGIISGDALKVMQQAVTICLECVGIG